MTILEAKDLSYFYQDGEKRGSIIFCVGGKSKAIFY